MTVNFLRSAVVKTTVWLLLLSCCSFRLVNGAVSFMYNDDVECGYPFEDFEIKSVLCSTFYGNRDEQQPQDYNYYYEMEEEEQQKEEEEEEEEAAEYDEEYSTNVCSFGERMFLEGEVTLSEDVNRYFDIVLKVCFQEEDTTSWFANKKCIKRSLDFVDLKNMDLGIVEDEENDENDNNDAYKSSSGRKYFLTSGTHAWSTIVKIPQKKFAFKSGYIVTAKIIFYPYQKYIGDVDNYSGGGYCSFEDDEDDENKFCDKTICTATFDAVGNVDDNYGYYRSSRYAAASVVVAVVCAAALFAVRGKRRIITTCCRCGDDQAKDLGEQVADDDDSVVANFQQIQGD